MDNYYNTYSFHPVFSNLLALVKTLSLSSSLYFSIFSNIVLFSIPNIWQAKIAAFIPPLIAKVATGTPGGICTIDKRESNPSKLLPLIGTLITGREVNEAIIHGR